MNSPLDTEALDGLFCQPIATTRNPSPLSHAALARPLQATAAPVSPAHPAPHRGGGIPAALGFLALGLFFSGLSAWSHFAAKTPSELKQALTPPDPSPIHESQVEALQSTPPAPPWPNIEPWVLPISFASVGPTHLPEPPTWLAACPQLEVVGHTCTAGDPAFNEALSTRRAAHVANLLVKHGLPRPLHRGAGAASPRATNTTRAGRIANRRVEVHCLPPSPDTPH
jgi:hypothetical protein